MIRNWYAVYTRPQKERKVAAQLTKKGIENYCPVIHTINTKGNDKKLIFEPLFNSYVFVFANDQDFALIKSVPDVINVIYWKSKPAVINHAEIEAVKHLTSNYTNIRLEKSVVNQDAPVQRIEEPLIAFNENSVSVKYKSVKINLPSLGYTMIAERANQPKEKVVYEEAGKLGFFPKTFNSLFFN